MNNIKFTREGFEKLKQELYSLETERPSAVLDLKKARDMGDLSENGYYKAARFKLSSIDHKLRVLKSQIKQAVIIASLNNQNISIGNTIVLEKENQKITYEIVGDLEANPDVGKISVNSPLGKALAGKKLNDEVTITAPIGKIKYKIIKIS